MADDSTREVGEGTWSTPKLLVEGERKILDHLRQHWKEDICPICESREWNISGPAHLPAYWGRAGSPERHFPLVPVACSVCGYTVLFNAAFAGINTRDLREWQDAVVAAVQGEVESKREEQ